MAKKKPISTTEKLIHPTVVSGEKHLLEDMFENGEFPEMKAVGYMRLGGGAGQWASYVLTVVGDKVTRIDIDEPNIRAVADEATKINFVHNFTDVDAF